MNSRRFELLGSRGFLGKDNDWLQACVAKFEDAWRQAKSLEEAPALESFLPPASDPRRNAALEELVKIDLEIRWRRQQPAYLEQYAEQHEELKTDRISPFLVFEEYRTRTLYGDKPLLAGYQTRFPGQFDEVQRLVQEEALPNQIAHSAALPPLARSETGPARSLQGSKFQFGEGYRPLERLGSGTYGEVWKAEAPGGVEVALKVIFRPIDHAEGQRELQSLEIIKRLRHPYLLQIHGYASLDDRLIIAMELADGTLLGRLQECQKAGYTGIPVKELLGYFRETAEALDYLHSQHVQHRDVKPENILLMQRHAKVADFGLARLQESMGLTSATFSGTPAFMAPEVWAGMISPQSDQYSLGMTYITLRLARRPFPGTSLPEVMNAHLHDTPELGALEPAEQEAILRAIAKKPENRFANCGDFVRALESAFPKEAVVSRPLLRGDDTDPFATLLPGQSSPDLPTLVASSHGTMADAATAPPTKKPPWRTLVEILGFFLVLGLLITLGVHLFLNKTPPEKVYLPPGCQIVDNETVTDLYGKHYYKRIARPTPDGMQQIEFVAVPRKKKSDTDTFYIMVDKVSVEQFRQFAEARSDSLKDSQWNMNADKDTPVLNVTVTEAYQFASEWLEGNLPTLLQWDQAAGRYEDDPGEGPYRGTWGPGKLRIAVNRTKEQGPMKVGEAEDDLSPFGCRDMSGNGAEWTRNCRPPINRIVPVLKPSEEDFVECRGQDFKAPAPLRFSELNPESPLIPSPEYGSRHDYIGFRVVIECEP